MSQQLGEQKWPANTLLAALAPADALALVRLGSGRTFTPDQTLIREGLPPAEVFVLLEGTVKVFSDTEDGRRILLSIRVAGDLVGELAVLDDQPRLATVIAAGKVVASAIPGPRFLAFLDERPPAAQAVHRAVRLKLRMATRYRTDISSTPVLARLGRVLAHLAALHGREEAAGLVIDVRLTQGDLAALTGSSGPSLQRALVQLRKHRIIRTGPQHGRIVILAPPALELLAKTGVLPAAGFGETKKGPLTGSA